MFKVGDKVEIIKWIRCYHTYGSWCTSDYISPDIGKVGTIASVTNALGYVGYEIEDDSGEMIGIYASEEIKLITMQSPLGRVCVPVDTEEKWIKLMQACEDHEYGFKWGDKNPTQVNYWYEEEENSVICFGWDQGVLTDKENIIGYDDVDYFKEYNAKFISFEEAMEKLKLTNSDAFTANFEYCMGIGKLNKHLTNYKMSLLTKVKALTKTEPEKSLHKAGITDINDQLTEDGKTILWEILLQNNKEELAKIAKELIKETK